MNAETEIPSPSKLQTAQKRRGRPSGSAAETPQQRIGRLENELRQAQEALKISEERRASIVGNAALRHWRHNAEFARQLGAALRAEVKVKADQAVIGDLMAGD